MSVLSWVGSRLEAGDNTFLLMFFSECFTLLFLYLLCARVCFFYTIEHNTKIFFVWPKFQDLSLYTHEKQICVYIISFTFTYMKSISFKS